MSSRGILVSDQPGTDVAADADTARLAERYGKAWNEHDLTTIMAMHTADTRFRLHLLAAPPANGQAEVSAAFAGLLALWPDITFHTERLECGTEFFVHQYIATATLAAPLPLGALVAQPTAEPIRFSGTDVIIVSDGLVHSKETYLDIAEAQQQLGLLGEAAE